MAGPPDWLFSLEQLKASPSRQDGIGAEDEHRFRWEGAQFIRDIGNALDLQPRTYCAGITLYHRFYALYSFKAFPRYDMAAACLFVGGKVEEQPKKLRDLLPVVHQLLQRIAGPETTASLEHGGHEFKALKGRILASERVLLQALRFDLVVEMPFRPLITFARAIAVDGQPKCPDEIVQTAWNYVSDSFTAPLCIQYPPQIIAAALLHLAGKIAQTPLQLRDASRALRAKVWWQHFLPDTPEEQIEDVCHQLLNLYDWLKKKQDAAPPSAPEVAPESTDTAAGKGAAQLAS